jgi:hypothetical protein
MPVKRRLGKARKHQITPEAIAAWQACDYLALHCALGLGPGEASPLPEEITALGISEETAAAVRSNTQRCYEMSYPTALALQRELLAIAGWPDCRDAYEKNLADAERDVAYCYDLVRDPDSGGRGTGYDMASRRRKLKEALAELAYRKRLLAELEA